MDIRILRPGDEALLARAVELADEGPLRHAQAAAHLADHDLINVVALDDGEPAGFIYGYVLRRFTKTSFFIYSVDVKASHQRRGIGTAMLAALKMYGKQVGWDEMFVFTNASNAAGMTLYSRAGGVRPNPDDVMFDFEI